MTIAMLMRNVVEAAEGVFSGSKRG
jgi:5,10-methylene-tetrahydrofolate dehydrogenase/methenyl tetrahydrofolate cyclohydrolase